MMRIDLGRDSIKAWQRNEQQRQREDDVLAPTGAHLWRTHDAKVAKKFRKLATAEPLPPSTGVVSVSVEGAVDQVLRVIISDGTRTAIGESSQGLEQAEGTGLSTKQVRKAVGTLGNTSVSVAGEVEVTGLEGLWLPISQIKQARRQAVESWTSIEQDGPELSESLATVKATISDMTPKSILSSILPKLGQDGTIDETNAPRLSILCRTFEQVDAICEAIESGQVNAISEIVVDFLELDGMREAFERIRQTEVRGVVASPRILKPEEGGIWKSLLSLKPDAMLVRSTGLLHRMQTLGGTGARVDVGTSQEEDWVAVPELIGDFSLNVANALTASELLDKGGLSRVTASYDLNARSILHMAELLQGSAGRLEVVAHCHMPIFHTEHCVFARFLTKGNSYLDCGHVCTRSNVHLRDELTGQDNLVLADMGCRNTVFAAQAQSGIHSLKEWNRAGIRQFRIELVDEDRDNTLMVIGAYTDVLRGDVKASQAWDGLEYIRDSNGRAAGLSFGSFRNAQERRAGEIQ
jgi:hypothetical protein